MSEFLSSIFGISVSKLKNEFQWLVYLFWFVILLIIYMMFLYLINLFPSTNQSIIQIIFSALYWITYFIVLLYSIFSTGSASDTTKYDWKDRVLGNELSRWADENISNDAEREKFIKASNRRLLRSATSEKDRRTEIDRGIYD